MPLGSLGQLGGLFAGDSTAFSFKQDVDDVTKNLLAGGQGRTVGNMAAQQADNATRAMSQQNTSNPALAARQGAQAGQQARVAGVMQGAQMSQQAQMQGAQMAQQRIEAERARVGNALGAGLGMASQLGAMMIPGAQAAPIAGAVGQMAQGAAQAAAPQAPPMAPAPTLPQAGAIAAGPSSQLSDEEILRSLGIL